MALAKVMLQRLQNFVPVGSNSCRRYLNSDLSTALRPFYFAVHPDFFGKHPLERLTNEESLKVLSDHLESLSSQKSPGLTESRLLPFYLRDGSSGNDGIRYINIPVDKATQDPEVIVRNILEICNFTPELRLKEKPNIDIPVLETDTEISNENEQSEINLDNWISRTAAKAQMRSKEIEKIRMEVYRLEKSLVNLLGIRETRYECGWNIERYLGCLSNLEHLAITHKKQLEVLHDRIVVFGPYTGINLDGNVMLFTGEGPNSWLEFINALTQYETYLKLVPLYEQALSTVLLGIQIKRRHLFPTTEAKAYANQLLRMISSINEHLNSTELPKQLPDSLHDHQMAIVGEGEQPKVSFTGLFLAPASCSGAELFDFIANNLEIARDRYIKYKKDMSIERKLWVHCKYALRLHNLSKDDSVTPDKMIVTLRHLLKCQSKSYQDISIHVTNYYSVLTDGIVCIPWDFMYRKSSRACQKIGPH